ncbi:peptide chain release factor N(5)-glutamine methyltransferase [Thalassorhabdomicrobium marinisediminis]|uniref:peptide chain release factor N(5)-glutamine methyltransferase n=1 Tax=Thalassorhabdomicrobium marinisediminis TaxID=2170577 RepID=UPI002410F2BC|nr:peptide chain release factor N(5)-glutamine methyltransferase [Thalassorhabdomicrobium marinisediminis]
MTKDAPGADARTGATGPPAATVQDVLRHAATAIPQRDARLLLAHVLDVPADRMTLILRDAVSAPQRDAFDALVARRAAGEPVSHLVGRRQFYGRWFEVTAQVLDPRPETETLIETALEVDFTRVLDLGTGSGCILLTLLAERPDATGLGLDLSEAAVELATRNGGALGAHKRAAFAVSDWFERATGRFDLVVSNPPYIAAEEMPGLAVELSFEPRMALTDEGDGLSCYRRIAAGADAHLHPGGWLMVEIGPTQAQAVAGMFTAAGLGEVGIRQDLDGRDRVVLGRKPL